MNQPLMTSLTEIAKHEPCSQGWDALLELRGHEPCSIEDFKGNDTLFPVSEIGKLGKISWIFWTARLFDGDQLKLYRWFALWCANQVRHLMLDDRSKRALNVAKMYLNGEASRSEIVQSSSSAYAAAAAAYSAAVADADAADAADAAAVVAADAAADADAYSYADAIKKQIKKFIDILDNGVFDPDDYEAA